MAKHLTEIDVENIISTLDGWQGKLTWSKLCDKIAEDYDINTSRQTLDKYPRIKLHFQSLKGKGLGSSRTEKEEIKTPPSLKIAGERIARLEKENERLKKENRLLLEQFVVWQYNAHTNQLSEEKLNKPLPTIDREVTKT